MHYGRKAEKKIKKSLIKSFQLEQNPGQYQLESRDQKPTPSIKCLQSKRDPCSPKYSVTLGELISPKHIKMPLILIGVLKATTFNLCTLTLGTTAMRRPQKWETVAGNVNLEKGVHKQRCTVLLCDTCPVCPFIVKNIMTEN